MPTLRHPCATFSLGALLALAGCTSPATPNDTLVADAADVSAAPDANNPLDASPEVSAPDAAPDAVADASATDATPEAGSCVDVSGGWAWTGTCSDPNVVLSPSSCIAQTGCTVIETGPLGTMGGTVAGNTLTETNTMGGSTQNCTVVVTGDTATAHCVNTGPAFTCDATGTRTRFAGASSYCCAPSATSCGAGQRCTPFVDGTQVHRFTACVAGGTIAEGGSCTRAGGVVGADDCVAGTTCVNFGHSVATERTCQRLCANGDGCPASEACLTYTQAPTGGVCVPGCTFNGTDCAAGLTCRGNISLGGAGPNLNGEIVETSCSLVGAVPLGGACTDVTDCGANAECFLDFMVAGSTPVCVPNCDATHACPAGLTCRLQRTADVNRNGVSHCFPE